MKVVINGSYGGFSLSHQAFLRLRELGSEVAQKEPDIGEFWDDGSGPRTGTPLGRGRGAFCRDIPRNDPLLVQAVEELGDKADGACANLKIVDIPDDVEWEVEEYDGNEWVCEKHRRWS